jgi:flagellar assembly protein FliH
VANLSEWIGALAEPAAAQPGWMALLAEPEAFREAMPFAQAPEPVPEPEPEPAEPDVDALAEAYAEGVAAGRAAAEAEAVAETARQRSLRLAFRELDEAALTALSQDLADTVIALCEGALTGAALDREALLNRCEAAARRIGGAAATLRLHLHPDDIALIGAEALAGWTVTPDPALERGGVLIEGADGAVSDGPADWRRAIAAAVRG